MPGIFRGHRQLGKEAESGPGCGQRSDAVVAEMDLDLEMPEDKLRHSAVGKDHVRSSSSVAPACNQDVTKDEMMFNLGPSIPIINLHEAEQEVDAQISNQPSRSHLANTKLLHGKNPSPKPLLNVVSLTGGLTSDYGYGS